MVPFPSQCSERTVPGMVDTSTVVTIPHLVLDRSTGQPLYRQLYAGLREAILTGQLPANSRLPATRVLANAYGISRNTVMNAYEQLFAEGYVRGKIGSGTYVAQLLPDHLLQPTGNTAAASRAKSASSSLSRRGRVIASTAARPRGWGGPVAFRATLPAVDAFPHELWAKLMTRRLRNPTYDLLGYHDPAGYLPLREAIASYLRASRGVRCDASRVIIVSGSQQALDLSARMLLDEGDAAWMEDPGYPGARNALIAAGARLVPVPVDREGLQVDVGIAREPNARLAFVTPSYEFPIGGTMSLARRLALLDWATKSGAWVLEDDCDSEYRYVGRPLAALQGLDANGRVIYTGSFSKVLFPSLRIGYMVVPSDLVGAFTAARALADRQSPMLEQAVLADFILEGHFVRHIQRMRALYRRRQMALVRAAERELADLLEVRPADAGMRLMGWLPDGVDDVAASAMAAEHGVEAPPLSLYCLEPYHRPGLLLGYAGISEHDIESGVVRLREALRALRTRT